MFEYGKESVYQFLQSGVMPDGKNVIDTDIWDQENLDAIESELKQYRLSKKQLKGVAETGNELLDDVFFTFNKYFTKAKEANQLQPKYIVNKYIEELAVELPEHAKLKVSSINDIVASGLACVDIEPELEKLLDKLKDEQEKASQLQQMMMEAAEAAASGDQETADGLAEAMVGLAGELDGDLEGKRVDVMQDLKNILESANEANQAMENALNLTGWGVEKGQKQKLSAEARIKLAESLKTDKIRKVMEMFGSFSKFAFAERAKKSQIQTDEIYDVTIGDNLSRILPSELLSMVDDSMSDDFYRRFMEENLSQFELKCKEQTQKGGIIFCEDGSGSMSGERELWAKAVGLTMLKIAQTEKRSFYGIHFGSPGQIEEYEFGNPVSHKDLTDFAELFFCGGTDYYTPLNRSLELLEKEFETDGCIGADIVFCTDGLCNVTDEWLEKFNERKEELGFKVWGILIGIDKSDVLEKICDETFDVNSLLDIKKSNVTDIFTGI